ncbi:MAG: hypothetical protein K5858_04725 [Lachnospiraceae bacterium]|nr:hypothetical protein [Lachnospiraceae bacterium]
MEESTLGNALKFYKEKYKLSQEDICYGICSIPTYSRIENGHKVRDSILSSSLLGRVGINLSRFEVFLDNQDFEFYKERVKLYALARIGRYEEVIKSIEQYEKHEGILSDSLLLHEQFCCMCKTVAFYNGKGMSEKLISLAEEGLAISCSDYNGLMNLVEINLASIAVLKRVDAVQMLLMLAEKVEKYFSGKDKENLSVDLYLKIIERLVKEQRFTEALFYIEKSVKIISEGKGIHTLGRLLIHQGLIQYELNPKDDNYIKTLKMAYAIMGITQNESGIDLLMKESKRRNIWQFIEWEA